MVNFKTSNKNTTIKVRGDVVPHVFISETALNKMFIYTKEAPGQDEIGWLGTAYYHKESNQYMIDDVFLFKQQVHGTTTEITTEGLEEFGLELLQQPDGVEIWNNLKMWGHSHVHMGISPSGQDDKQMEEFSKVGHDFFIRLICNKKGELGIDVYNYDQGFEFHNCNWSVIEEENEDVAKELEELQTRIDELQAKMEEERKAKVKEIEEPIKAEIKDKVSKLTYKYQRKPASNTYQQYLYGGYQYNPTNEDPFYTDYEIEQMARSTFSYQEFMNDIRFDGADKFMSNGEIQQLWTKIINIQKQDSFWGEGSK